MGDILIENGAIWSKDWKVDNMNFLNKAVKDGKLEVIKVIHKKKYFTEDDRINALTLAEEKIKNPTLNNDVKWKEILTILKNADKRDGIHDKEEVKNNMKKARNSIGSIVSTV